MAIIFRLLRYPRARALAAWLSELVPSSKPLLMRLACQEMIPSQCSSTDLTKSFNGSSRERFAPKHQWSRYASASCCGWAGPRPDPVAGWTGLFRKPQRRKAINDRRRLHAHSDQALDKVDDVPWLASSGCPVVGVVDDAAGLVGLDLIAVHDPLDGGLAVDFVLVRLWRDTAEGQRTVVDDRGLVHDRAGFAEPHLGDMQVHVATHPAAVLVQRPGLDGFVVEMPGGQVTSGLAETPEVLDHRNTRDHLLQVSGEAFLVLRRVQHSVDVIEDVGLLDAIAVPAAVARKCGVRDRILAGVSVLVAFVKQDGILANPIVVAVS